MTTPVDPTVHPPTDDIDTAALVVVGGGPAGHSAVTAYREAGGTGRVLLISAEDTPPYRRPPLSKGYLRGEMEEGDLGIPGSDGYDDQQIEIWLGDPVSTLDTTARRIHTVSGREIGYQNCVLATGNAAAVPPVDGGDHPSVVRLRTLADARFLRTTAAQARRAVVIGSGFIGCEAAVSLASRGVEVTMVTSEDKPHLDRLGAAVAERVAGWLDAAGVRVVSSQPVVGIDPDGTVRTATGRYEADLVLAGVGVTPNTSLAESAGVPVRNGRIVVDDAMATAVAGVYAAGDVVVAHNAVAGRPLAVEHWGDAVRMGQIAGRSAAGTVDSWGDVPGFFSVIGENTLKYTAWGDGYDTADVVHHDDGGLTVWYSTDGKTVGVLTHNADVDYERGAELISHGAPPPVS